MFFEDRRRAGAELARTLAIYAGEHVVVYALARGGVVPGVELARALGAALDLIVVRKIDHMDEPAYTIAAVTESGNPVLNYWALAGVPAPWFERRLANERSEARTWREYYLGERPPVSAAGRIAIVVDDGVATGLTVVAALRDVQRHRPKRLVVAAPVIPTGTIEKLQHEADDVVALRTPDGSVGKIGSYYRTFAPVTDDQIVELLRAHARTTRPHVRVSRVRLSSADGAGSDGLALIGEPFVT